MYPPQQAQYDRAITVFSPDGRLFQVEYAREAVRTGTPCVGIVVKDAVILAAHKRISSSLIVPESHEKIFQIDKHIVAASSGLIADARKLVDFARLEAQRHRIVYGTEIPIETLAKKIGDQIQTFTQFAGVRPYGVSLLIAGMNGTFKLFETDPSGALFEYKATGIGSGKKTAEDFFEKEFSESISQKEGLKLALKALKKTVEEKLTPSNVDVAVISKEHKKVVFLKKDELEKLIAEIK
ncbi:MAG TPA: archaeal proteasome endopeptidase complex subunit alpha [Candidatus Norongarragalinales archaeon]|nr:archaeal proteasome endopeptidase complex subunit alpha [Candidatus Norongarragalinales archaeon]